MKSKDVFLSFDIEEFDFPRERGEEISLEEGVKVSGEGTRKILDILKKTGARATFFVTGNFAKARPEFLAEMLQEGHEIAAHGVDHFIRKDTDVKEAKRIIEESIKKESGKVYKIRGWRQPRMGKINYADLKKYGYKYDSSLNPAFIPGRYNNFKMKTEPFLTEEGILEIPASVATKMRVPMFWLALHSFPFRLYLEFTKSILKKSGIFVTYFHPWEFTDLSKYPIVPFYIKHNSGEKLEKRLEKLILELEKDGVNFRTLSELKSSD